MRRLILAASIAAATLTSAADAQETCEQRRDNRTVGTVAGAGIGAVLGGAIGGNALGAVLGAVGGGVAGNQIAKGPQDCVHAYGYYDGRNQWHANNIRAEDATGFYDRNGNWVAGAPAGYYDNRGNYVAGRVDPNNAGYRDEHGHWVPAGSSAYYEPDGSRVDGVLPGYWDNGRWVQGRAVGSYDADGRWMSGRLGGYRDSNGNWVASPQPGYYDRDGRWNRGQAVGYYDATGNWIATGGYGAASTGNATGYANSYYGDAKPGDYRARIARTNVRIDRAVADGSMTDSQASRARRDLNMISRQAATYPHYRDGTLAPRGQTLTNARLDEINRQIRDTRQESRNY